MLKDEENVFATLEVVYHQIANVQCRKVLSTFNNEAVSQNIKAVPRKNLRAFHKTRFFPLLPNSCFLKLLEFLPISCCLCIAEVNELFSSAVDILFQKRRYLRRCARSGFEDRSIVWPKIAGVGDWSRDAFDRCLAERRDVLLKNSVEDPRAGFRARLDKLKKWKKPVPTDLRYLYIVHKDIGRTLVKDLRDPVLLRILSRILGAYSMRDPEVGYCQGMNFLTGILLLSLRPPTGIVSTSKDSRTRKKPQESLTIPSKLDSIKKPGSDVPRNILLSHPEARHDAESKDEDTLSNSSATSGGSNDSEDASCSELITAAPEDVQSEDSLRATSLEYKVFAIFDQLMRYNKIPEQEGLYRTIAPSGKSGINPQPKGWSGLAAGGFNSKYGTLGYGLRYYFLPKLPRASISFVHLDKLLELYIPEVHAHFLELHVSPQIFCAEWYFTIFSYTLPLPLTQRVWDVYLVDGTKALHRFALTMLDRLKQQILDKDFGTTIRILKSAKTFTKVNELFFDKSDVRPGDGFINQSFKYKITNRRLHTLSNDLLKIASSFNKTAAVPQRSQRNSLGQRFKRPFGNAKPSSTQFSFNRKPKEKQSKSQAPRTRNRVILSLNRRHAPQRNKSTPRARAVSVFL